MHSGWHDFCKEMNGKRVLVLGLGSLGGGEGVARTLQKAGAVVRISDKKTAQELESTLIRLQELPLEYSLGVELLSDVDWADIIVKNPSVPVENPLLLHARKTGKPIVNDVTLFLQHTKTKTIGITGTRGKSTTTAMMSAVLQLIDPHSNTAGNIPGEPCLPLLETEHDQSWTVLELSSFQLEGCHEAKISPNAVIVTNLHPDHLNRYPSMEAYAEAKAAILAYQHADDVAVLSKRNAWTPFFQRYVKGTFTLYSVEDLPENLVLRVPGEHNKENAAAVFALCALLKFPVDTVRRALENFSGVPFRLQTVATKRGVRFINDTTSTTPVALIQALRSIPGRLHMIVGGSSKGLPIEEAAHELNEKSSDIYLLQGSGTSQLRPYLREELIAGEYDNLSQAVQAAYAQSQAGDAVVLSPGFASFGMFRNEFDRGTKFNEIVNGLGE